MIPGSVNSVEATILGQTYTLACTPGSEAVLGEAVSIVDREMSAIRDAGRVKARDRIAVLTALNLAWQQIERRHEQAAGRAQAANDAVASAPAAAAAAADDDGTIDALIRRLDAALADEPDASPDADASTGADTGA